MTKTKTEKNPLDLLKKAFYESVNDKELQDRYNRFVYNLKKDKENYNQLVPKINEAISRKNRLQEIILRTVLEGIMPTDVIETYKSVSKEVEELSEHISKYQYSIDENENLIKKYQDNSDQKLFYWWKSFHAIDPKGTSPWIEWKRLYEKIII